MPRGVPKVKNLSEAQSKWQSNAKAAKTVWASEVSKDAAFTNYVQAIATLLGVEPETIRKSMPAANWRTFQTKATEKTSKYESGIDRAARENKWADKWRKAYTEKLVARE